MLAGKLTKFRGQNAAVVALSDGAVIIGAEIALKLRCVLTMLLTESIKLPGEHDALAVVDQEGGFTYNSMFSAGQLDGFTSEYQTFIEQSKREKFHELNNSLGKGGIIRPDLLINHQVIVVSDGLETGVSLEAALNYLKPITLDRLIIVTPLASVPAVDKMHLFADEIVCLSVVENYMGTDHYYEDNNLPEHGEIVKTIEGIVLNWQ